MVVASLSLSLSLHLWGEDYEVPLQCCLKAATRPCDDPCLKKKARKMGKLFFYKKSFANFLNANFLWFPRKKNRSIHIFCATAKYFYFFVNSQMTSNRSNFLLQKKVWVWNLRRSREKWRKRFKQRLCSATAALAAFAVAAAAATEAAHADTQNVLRTPHARAILTFSLEMWWKVIACS